MAEATAPKVEDVFNVWNIPLRALLYWVIGAPEWRLKDLPKSVFAAPRKTAAARRVPHGSRSAALLRSPSTWS